MSASVFLFSHLPFVLSCRKSIAPALEDHPLSFLLKILSNTAYAHIGFFLILIKSHFDMIVAHFLS